MVVLVAVLFYHWHHASARLPRVYLVKESPTSQQSVSHTASNLRIKVVWLDRNAA